LIVVGSRSHQSKETAEYFDLLNSKYGDIEIISMGSSLKICLVAEGKADIYPRFAPTMEWDTAAGHAIVNSAGKNLIEYNTNKEMTYNRKNLRNNWFIVK
jgi:3'(2'), 5'-bisphosphate nucleotidase